MNRREFVAASVAVLALATVPGSATPREAAQFSLSVHSSELETCIREMSFCIETLERHGRCDLIEDILAKYEPSELEPHVSYVRGNVVIASSKAMRRATRELSWAARAESLRCRHGGAVANRLHELRRDSHVSSADWDAAVTEAQAA